MTTENKEAMLEGEGLLQGIIDAARKEASANLDQARKQAAAIQAESQDRIRVSLAEETVTQDSQLAVLQARFDSQVRAYQRKLSLKQHSALFSEVLSRLESDIQEIPSRPDYPALLSNWIVEGILGLGLDEVIVSCGQNDPVDDKMLCECAEQAMRRTGRKYKVSLGYSNLIESGVIISSPDQRVSFNNLISSRLRRYKSEINDIVEGEACRTE